MPTSKDHLQAVAAFQDIHSKICKASNSLQPLDYDATGCLWVVHTWQLNGVRAQIRGGRRIARLVSDTVIVSNYEVDRRQRLNFVKGTAADLLALQALFPDMASNPSQVQQSDEQTVQESCLA